MVGCGACPPAPVDEQRAQRMILREAVLERLDHAGRRDRAGDERDAHRLERLAAASALAARPGPEAVAVAGDGRKSGDAVRRARNRRFRRARRTRCCDRRRRTASRRSPRPATASSDPAADSADRRACRAWPTVLPQIFHVAVERSQTLEEPRLLFGAEDRLRRLDPCGSWATSVVADSEWSPAAGRRRRRGPRRESRSTSCGSSSGKSALAKAAASGRLGRVFRSIAALVGDDQLDVAAPAQRAIAASGFAIAVRLFGSWPSPWASKCVIGASTTCGGSKLLERRRRSACATAPADTRRMPGSPPPCASARDGSCPRTSAGPASRAS